MEHQTKEMLAGTTLPSSNIWQHVPPKNASFQLSDDELKAIMPEFVIGKRMRLKKNWTSIFREHLLCVTPYTTWVFTDSSVTSQKSHKLRVSLFKANGTCAEQYCNAQIECQASKDQPHNVECRLGKTTCTMYKPS